MVKNIAIMGSGTGRNFSAIINYFKNYNNIKFTCLSDNLNSEILKTAEQMNIDRKYLPYEENIQYLASKEFDLIVLSGYRKTLDEETLKIGKFINIHPSLLPSFKGEDAIHRAFISGVKVSGVTVHQVGDDIEECKILAQYPVLIGLTTHFDEFEEEIHQIEDKLYPPVIQAIIEDRVFDFPDLFKNNCHKSGGCNGGCNGCQG